MACFYSCLSVFLLFFQCKTCIHGRLVNNEFEAPLDLKCFDGITVPDESLDTTFNRSVERAVLQQLFIETRGHNWTKQSGWSSTGRQSNLTIDHCSWAGVTCRDGYVIGLTLNKNNLSGQIPSCLWKLRNLRAFCLPSNNLSGELKDFIFPNMTKLLRVDLSFCYFSGRLPENIFASFKSLQKIQLCCQKSNQRLNGSIPENITNLLNLKVLSLGENDLDGEIPQGIGKLKKVWFLDLEYLSVNGNISIFLGMTSLKKMHLSSAGIYGVLPDDFGDCFPHLIELMLPLNPGISGPIPSSIDKMTNLTTIIMHSNELQQTIPKQLGNLPHLRILDLSNNHFQGIHSELTFKGSPGLEILLLGNNQKLSVNVSTLITALTPTASLMILDISNCVFNGSLDTSIWALTSLIELNLNRNKIGGSIPEVHNDYMFLNTLDLSHNEFEGEIPGNFRLLQSLMFIDIRGNPKMRAPVSKINVTSGDIQNIMRVTPNFRQKNVEYSCPFATLTSTNGSALMDESYYGYIFCVCGKGYYGSLAQCKKCMPNGNCSGETKSTSLLDNDVPQIVMTLARGYWPSPSVNNVTHLVECPSFPSEKDWACNPHGDCQCWFNVTSHTTVCNKSRICHSGSTNRLCSMCIDGYYKSGSLCIGCQTQSTQISAYVFTPVIIICLLAMLSAAYLCSNSIRARFIIAFVELVFLVTFRLVDVITGWFLEVSVVLLFFYVAGISENTRGIISILVFYIQVLDAMISANNSPIPKFVVSVQHYMSSIMNLDFTGISCQYPILFTPLYNYLLVFMFPIACLLLIWMIYGFRAVIVSRTTEAGDPLRDFRSSCKKVSITCLCLTFFPVSKQIITILAPCEDDDEISYLRIAPWVQCSEDDPIYLMLQLLGWLGVILYIIGVPVLLQSLLIWYKWNRDNFSEENRNLCNSWLGAIYQPYKENVQWYFEILKLLRKLFIAVFLAVFPHTSSMQTLTVSIVLIISLIYQLKFEPYYVQDGERSFENFLEVLTLAVLHQSFIMLRFASYDVESSKVIVYIVIALNIGVIVAFIVAIPAVIINLCCSTTPQEVRQPLLQSNPGSTRT